MQIEDADSSRVYTNSEQVRLTYNLRELVEQIFRIDSQDQTYSVELICEWHRKLFLGVRDHAGRIRDDNYGEHYLTFGPVRSAYRGDVPRLLAEHVRMARYLGDDLDGRVEHEVVEGALHIHANLIKIHPFRDGNGRVGRLALSYWLRRKRLPPVFFENAKEDYLRAMNHMYLHGDTGPLLHLALSLYRKQL